MVVLPESRSSICNRNVSPTATTTIATAVKIKPSLVDATLTIGSLPTAATPLWSILICIRSDVLAPLKETTPITFTTPAVVTVIVFDAYVASSDGENVVSGTVYGVLEDEIVIPVPV